MLAQNSIKKKNSSNVELSVVIPCHNEESLIEKTLMNIINEIKFSEIKYEIICVNNNSSDETENILKKNSKKFMFVKYFNTVKKNGYGIAIKEGIKHCKGEAVIFVMADGSENASDIVLFYNYIQKGYDCVFGNRFSKSNHLKKYPFLKYILNRLGNNIISFISFTKFKDFTNGFKCYRLSVIKKLKPFTSDNFNINLEISLGATFSKFKIIEIANTWEERDFGKSKFNILKQCILFFVIILITYYKYNIKDKIIYFLNRLKNIF